MPQIADLEIAATWDEIELEAALRGRSAEAQTDSPAESPARPSETELLRVVEELKQLPKAERKRRAEELLRTLTSAPAAQPESKAAPEDTEPTAAEAPSPEPAIDATPEVSEALADAARSPELALDASPDFSEALADEPSSVEPTVDAPPDVSEALADELPNAEPAVAASPEASAPPAEESPDTDLMAAASPEISEPIAPEPPSAEPAAAETVRDPAPNAEPAAAEPVEGSLAVSESDAEAPAAAPVLEASASVPAAEPMPAAAPESAPIPEAELQSYSIPKFLATECASREPEHPDSLIPLRTAAAACALVGAVLLIYFGTSQELGVAARTVAGASEVSDARVVPPEISPSVAVRQAFVAPPPVYSETSEPVRSYRPPFVGFDFLDDTAPPPATAVKPEAPVEPSPSQASLVVPQSSAEDSAAPPASLGSQTSALIKRGDALLKAGDIAAARSAYERAAVGGNAKAQIGVGKTYDPLVLAKLGARGVRGDPVQAASWYARAGEAGDEEGQQRLHALISGLSDCMLAQGSCAPRKP
ncbi:MAG TPA: hypothetical protein VN823_20735 [Stellaceae bacterium]|nr:hypothetical protein [Stellaceae bacterium]